MHFHQTGKDSPFLHEYNGPGSPHPHCLISFLELPFVMGTLYPSHWETGPSRVYVACTQLGGFGPEIWRQASQQQSLLPNPWAAWLCSLVDLGCFRKKSCGFPAQPAINKGNCSSSFSFKAAKVWARFFSLLKNGVAGRLKVELCNQMCTLLGSLNKIW